MKTDITTILYIIQVVSLTIALVCTIIMYTRMMKALNYMKVYCEKHNNKKSTIAREFRKVIKILGGK